MVTLIAFDNLFPPFPGDILAGTRSTMTAAITFSCQNDAGSRVRTTFYWENLVLVDFLIVESNGLCYV